MTEIKPASLETDEQKVSYGLGWQFGRHLLTHNFAGLDMETTFAGMLDCFNEKEAPITDQEVETAFKTIAARVEVARQRKSAELAGRSQAFMAENALKPGIISTKSGLQYKLRRIGFKQRITFTVVLLVTTALLITDWLAYNHFKKDKITAHC